MSDGAPRRPAPGYNYTTDRSFARRVAWAGFVSRPLWWLSYALTGAIVLITVVVVVLTDPVTDMDIAGGFLVVLLVLGSCLIGALASLLRTVVVPMVWVRTAVPQGTVLWTTFNETEFTVGAQFARPPRTPHVELPGRPFPFVVADEQTHLRYQDVRRVVVTAGFVQVWTTLRGLAFLYPKALFPDDAIQRFAQSSSLFGAVHPAEQPSTRSKLEGTEYHYSADRRDAGRLTRFMLNRPVFWVLGTLSIVGIVAATLLGVLVKATGAASFVGLMSFAAAFPVLLTAWVVWWFRRRAAPVGSAFTTTFGASEFAIDGPDGRSRWSYAEVARVETRSQWATIRMQRVDNVVAPRALFPDGELWRFGKAAQSTNLSPTTPDSPRPSPGTPA